MKPFKTGSEAIKTKLQQAKAGNVAAQCELGTYYFTGNNDVDQNYAEALKWFDRAAQNNDAEAQYYVGKMYYEGLGVPSDWAEAYKWLSISSQNRYVYDLDEFGAYTGMATNTQKSRYAEMSAEMLNVLKAEIPKEQLKVGQRDIGQWYESRANNGDPDAQIWMADNYFFGQSFPQSYVKAYQWYKIAQNSYYFIKNHGCNKALAESASDNIALVEAKIAEMEANYIDIRQMRQMSILLASWFKNAYRRGVPAAERAVKGWDNAEKGCAI